MAAKPDPLHRTHRKLSVIAFEITKSWQPMSYAARPYVEAMRTLNSINDKFGADDARSVVLYFLSNAATWRGDDARRIKAELKAMVRSTGYKL